MQDKGSCNCFTWRDHRKIRIFDLWLDKNEEGGSLDTNRAISLTNCFRKIGGHPKKEAAK